MVGCQRGVFDDAGVPLCEAFLEFEAGELCLYNFNLSAEVLQGSGDNHLVLDRIKRTRGIRNLAANFEEVDAPEQDLSLELVQVEAQLGRPSLPRLRHFSDRRVRTTWYIAQYPIEFEIMWVALSLMINDYKIGRVESVELMAQHKRPFVIGVIGYDESPRFRGARMAQRMQVVTGHEIQGLRCLATRSSTHIKD